ncbi:MAG: hypothetical protein ACI4SB_02580 [Acutalibacteraceae bacterium]
MKIRTFRLTATVLLVVSNVLFIWYSDELCRFLFGTGKEVLFDYGNTVLIVSPILAAAAIMFMFLKLKKYDYSVLPKKGLAIASAVLAVLMLFPLPLFVGRTEITSDSVVRHNFLGQSTVYNVSDCENVTVYFRMEQYLHRSGLGNPYLSLDYELYFPDGYAVTLFATDDDTWWSVIDGINTNIEKAGVEKTVYAADRTQFTDREWREYGIRNGMLGHEEIVDKLCRKTPE